MSGHHRRPSSKRQDLPHESRRPQATPERHAAGEPRKQKPSAAVVCDECKLVHHAGRWFEGAPPVAELSAGLCPACRRVRDHDPAGEITVPEGFLEQREEVLGMLRNAESAERAEHPLERLMDLEEGPDGSLVVTTTGMHLARAIANKLERRFHRQARFRYAEEQSFVRVDWEA